jgi:hypothetical protein
MNYFLLELVRDTKVVPKKKKQKTKKIKQTNKHSKVGLPYGKPKGGISMLRYGKGNNTYKYKMVISHVVGEHNGNPSKLIHLECYMIPILSILQNWE